MSETRTPFSQSPAVDIPNYCSFCGYKFTLTDTACQHCQKPRPMQKSNSVKWKRVLYEKQPFEDNYIDSTFLNSMKIEPQPQKLSYQELFLKMQEVSLAMAKLSLFVILFQKLWNNKVESESVIMVLGVLILGSAFLLIIFSPKIVKTKRIIYHIKGGIIVLGFVYFLSPIFRTFHANYADNTTYALICGLSVIHMVLKDYGYVYQDMNYKIQFDKSTYAIMYLSVIMGSRLQTSMQVFALWMAALTIFILLKIVLKSLRNFSKSIYHGFLLTFTFVMLVPLYYTSKLGLIFYTLMNFLVLIIGPLALIWFYQYKNVIRGPWDLPDVKQYEVEEMD